MSDPHDPLPLVYACSGCSNVAQLANDVAVRLDRTRVAEMSCIAGLGGDVVPLVKKAKSGRPIVAIDGCRLHCVAATLARHGLSPGVHVVLTDFGFRKEWHGDATDAEAEVVLAKVVDALPLVTTAPFPSA